MDQQQYISMMKNAEKALLEYIESENESECFTQFIKIFDDIKIRKNPCDLKLFLHNLTSIANNHQRVPHFFERIDKLLNNLKGEIQEFYANIEIFNIFKSNKRILLFLFEEKVLSMDKSIYHKISKDEYKTAKYIEYFSPEIHHFLKTDGKELELPNDFLENRKKGENESQLCKIIREDSIVEFIVYVNQTNLSVLSDKIPQSIFETNLILQSEDIAIIDYAFFFGSLQIIKYLQANEVELNSSNWIYAIHSNNPEIIEILESNNIKSNNLDQLYFDEFVESVKCHHNEIAQYIKDNYHLFFMKEKVQLNAFINYNFLFLNNEVSVKEEFFEVYIKYDYNHFARLIITKYLVDLECQMTIDEGKGELILIQKFQCNFFFR